MKTKKRFEPSAVLFPAGLFLLLGLLLSGCTSPMGGNTTATAPAPPDSAMPNPSETPQSAPPASSPLPTRDARVPVTVVTTCKTSTDCAVKNVGNCCGAMPACVNKDSPTDPAAVQAQCNAKGMMGICGFKEISACQCDNGQCVEAAATQGDSPGLALPLEPAR